MYRHNSNQLSFKDFCLPFSGHLRGNNRWIKLSELIPWELVEDIYVSKLRSDFGAPAHSARMAFGSLLIKERLGLSDEETVAQITENPYLQYFIGLKEFQEDAPFDASQLIYFRKRFSAEAADWINEAIATVQVRSKLEETGAPHHGKTGRYQRYCDNPLSSPFLRVETYPNELQMERHSRR